MRKNCFATHKFYNSGYENKMHRGDRCLLVRGASWSKANFSKDDNKTCDRIFDYVTLTEENPIVIG